jgi:hypothetical protein
MVKLRVPKVYMEHRECYQCGNDKTYMPAINRVQWHRHYDENGKWIGWLCHSCYGKKIRAKHNKEIYGEASLCRRRKKLK